MAAGVAEKLGGASRAIPDRNIKQLKMNVLLGVREHGGQCMVQSKAQVESMIRCAQIGHSFSPDSNETPEQGEVP